MRIRIITMSVLAILMLATGLFAQMKFPAKVGYMNDDARVLTPEQVKSIDDKLRAYDKKTSLQFMVVVIKSLNGADRQQYTNALGRAWGVGQAETNNGLVLMISIGDRTSFLSTGYGMEADLPDGIVGQIQRDKLVPAMKANKPFDGINAVVDAVMLRLGDVPAKQRQQALAEKAEQARVVAEANSRWWGMFWWIILFAAIFVLIFIVTPYLLIRKLLRIRKERQRKEVLTETLLGQVETQRQDVNESYVAFNFAHTAANVLRQERDLAAVSEFLKAGESSRNETIKQLDEFERLINEDPDTARVAMEDFDHNGVNNATTSILEVVERYKRSMQSAPSEVKLAAAKITHAEASLESLAKRKYDVDVAVELSGANAKLKQAKSFLSEHNYDPEKAIELAHKASERAMSRVEAFQYRLAKQKTVKDTISRVRTQAEETIKVLQNSAPTDLGNLRKYPETLWKKIDADFSRFASLQVIKALLNIVSDAEAKNSMEQQDFDTAETLVLRAATGIQNFANFVNAPAVQLSRLKEAQNLSKTMRNDLDRLASLVKKHLRMLDVGPQPSIIFDRANAELARLDQEVKAGGEYQDWVVINRLYSDLAERFEAAQTRAIDDRSEAQAERQRVQKREEAATAVAAATIAVETAAAQERQDDSSRSSSDSTPSVSTDTGFSGGGGDFGGGGAGSDW